MSDMTAGIPGLQRVADHWGLVVGYGVVTFGLGVLLAAWPGRTLVVCSVIFAIQLLVSGTVRIVTAIASGHIDGWIRALSGLSGAVAVIVGLLCLRDPLQTLLVVGLLLGAWLLVCGMVDLMSALVGAGSGNRVWGPIIGLVELVAGAYLMVNPELSLGALVVVSVAWLLSVGTIAVIAGFALRSERGRDVAVPAAPAT